MAAPHPTVPGRQPDPIPRSDFFPLTHYLYGEAYYGSCDGMRYRLAREPLEHVFYVPEKDRSPAVLRAVVWPEPTAYAHTPKEQMEYQDFDFSEEGLTQAVSWFNERVADPKWPRPASD